MSKTITKPRLVSHRPAEFDETPVVEVRPEQKAVSRSRSEVEVWNSSFPRRAWLDSEVAEQTRPQVRPAGHEGAAQEKDSELSTVAEVLKKIKKDWLVPAQIPGLCRYCVRLADCSYPKPEGGVWHCDEYE